MQCAYSLPYRYSAVMLPVLNGTEWSQAFDGLQKHEKSGVKIDWY